MLFVEERTFANGITVKLFDKSRKISGDRWAIKIVCELRMAIPVNANTWCAESGEELFQKFYEKMAGVIRYSIIKERNFVDDKERDKVIKALVLQFDETVNTYLNNLTFPKKLLVKEYEEFKLGYREPVPTTAQDTDENDGPADFSGCFRDLIDN